MDPVSPLTPSLRVDKVNLYQDNKNQQSPFGRGRILQGRITGKTSNQFILDVDGHQWLADSKAPLRIGQRLNLKVTGTTPNITLQILADPLTQNIGKSLHLLPEEGRLLPLTIDLAAQLPEGTLSTSSKQTLAFFKNAAAAFQKTPSVQWQQGSRLAGLLTDFVTSAKAGSEENSLSLLSAFLDELIQALPQQDPSRQSALLLRQQINESKSGSPLQELLAGKNNPEADRQLKTLLQNISSLPSTDGHKLADALTRFMGVDKTLSPSTFVLRLLTLTGNLLARESGTQKTEATGENLKKFTERIGTNLEQLLLNGKNQEATQTLKSALLEISHNLPENTPLHHQATQLTSTIELFQMLQIRFANEALLFLPLPLPFLDQGFLLIEPDQKQGGKQQEGQEEQKKYSLHLELAGLGNLRIDLEQQTGGMRIRFYTQDRTKTEFLAEHRRELEQWLTATQLESVQFLTGADDPVKGLLSRMSADNTGMLNTSA